VESVDRQRPSCLAGAYSQWVSGLNLTPGDIDAGRVYKIYIMGEKEDGTGFVDDRAMRRLGFPEAHFCRTSPLGQRFRRPVLALPMARNLKSPGYRAVSLRAP